MITKYQKEQTVTRLKKVYSTLSQAVSLSETENGITDNWNYALSSENFYSLYLKKYLVSAKDFGSVDLGTLGQDYKYLNGDTIVDPHHSLYTSQYRIVMNDGTFIFILRSYSTDYRSIYVDINGFNKPNKIGRDVFLFAIQKKYKVKPFGIGYSAIELLSTPNPDRTLLINYNGSHGCNKNKQGHFCSALIMKDGWRISDDYPW